MYEGMLRHQALIMAGLPDVNIIDFLDLPTVQDGKVVLLANQEWKRTYACNERVRRAYENLKEDQRVNQSIQKERKNMAMFTIIEVNGDFINDCDEEELGTMLKLLVRNPSVYAHWKAHGESDHRVTHALRFLGTTGNPVPVSKLEDGGIL